MVDHLQPPASMLRDRVSKRQRDTLPNWLRHLSLRKKVTAIAVVLGTLPVLGVGAASYQIADQSITQQVLNAQQVAAVRLSDLISRYMAQRVLDVQGIATNSTFADSRIRNTLTAAEKTVLLQRLSEVYGVYSQLAVFELDGNLMAQTIDPSAANSTPNPANQPYFQTVLKTNKPSMSSPVINSRTQTSEVYIAAPIKDSDSGKPIAIVRATLPIDKMSETLKSYTLVGREYRILDPANQVLLASQSDRMGRNALSDFPELSDLHAQQATGTRSVVDPQTRNSMLFSYTPGTRIANLPDLNWQVLLGNKTATAFQSRQQMLLVLGVGTALAAALAGWIAALLAHHLTRRIASVTQAVQALGEGHLETRLTVHGNDEITTLGTNINQMASRLQNVLQEKTQITEDLQRFNESIFTVRKSLDVPGILQAGVTEVRRLLECDRAIVYLFDEKWQGSIVAESVALGFPASLGAMIADPCFAQNFVEKYRQGRIHFICDVEKANLDPCYRGQLEPFMVKANLVAPMVVEGHLMGLLVAHQCSGPRDWTASEMNLFFQMAVHVGYSIEQVSLVEQRQRLTQAHALAEERQQQKESLQSQLVDLLSHVEKVALGDLTVRATVGAGEIGTVADFFNAIVENLQQLVQRVKDMTVAVNESLGSHEQAVRSLSQEAHQQAAETSSTLVSVDRMRQSIASVAESAQEAAQVSRSASETAHQGSQAMDVSVQNILSLRHTIGETGKKVKRLGESSQQISKVVSLIQQIAIQTNLLAINAGIEAARAGEEGQGFAAVAEEVGALAARASEATQDIEQLVATIQRETSDVAEAMEQGTAQVVEGTQCIEHAKHSLEQIVAVSHHIDRLVQSISSATDSQVETSQQITQLMSAIATVAERTSNSSHQVSDSLLHTVGMAQELRQSIDTFRVC